MPSGLKSILWDYPRTGRRVRGIVAARRADIAPRFGLIVHRRPTIERRGHNTTLELGAEVELFPGVCFYLDAEGARISLGARTYLNKRCEIRSVEEVTIGSDCAIAWDVHIFDCDYHVLDGGPSHAPVRIGDRVWIGARSTILKGVTIGSGSVVAAGSVVASDVPPSSLVGGVPARLLRQDVAWELPAGIELGRTPMLQRLWLRVRGSPRGQRNPP